MRKYDFGFNIIRFIFSFIRLVWREIRENIIIWFHFFLYLKKTKNCRKLIKSSSKIENFIFFYVNRIFRGSFDNFYKNRPKSAKIGKNRTNSQYITLHFTEYYCEMEKMESFKVFKTFFLISKMDKNKCPIFILKKKFQKMKIVFFWHFFSDLKIGFSYDEW
jgi:hypothetical protein